MKAKSNFRFLHFTELCSVTVGMTGEVWARRILLFFAGEAVGDEAVAYPGFGLDVLAAGFGFELFAELADEDAQILGLMRGLGTPYGGEQGAVGDDLAGVTREMKQEFKLFGREVQRLTGDFDAVGCCINHEVADGDGGLGALGSAAEVCANAGEQFLDAEWLGDIVIGAGVEGLNF